jgi:hypothetical protein
MPTCGACDADAVVSWQRRPTADELYAHVTHVQAWRQDRILLADAAAPAPTFGPLPTAEDTAIPVHSCAEHSVSMALAALMHASDCIAPCAPSGAACCVAEPAPTAVAEAAQPALPIGWQ